MTFNSWYFEASVPIASSPKIHTAEGSDITIGYVKAWNDNISWCFSCPSTFSKSFISWSIMWSWTKKILFSPSVFVFQDHLKSKQVRTCHRVCQLYVADNIGIPHQANAYFLVASTSTSSSFMSWHLWFVHMFFPRLRYMFNNGLLGSVTLDKEPCCVDCKLAKQPTLPFSNSTNISSFHFDLVHYDV